MENNTVITESPILDLTENKKGFFGNLFKKKNKNINVAVHKDSAIILFEQLRVKSDEKFIETMKMIEDSNSRIEKLEKLLTNKSMIKEDIIDVNVKLVIEPITIEGDKIVTKSHKLHQSREDMLNEICKWHPELTKQDILGQIILDAYNKYKPLTTDIIDTKKND